MTVVGQRVRRLEDRRLLGGSGRFVDDVDVAGQVWMRVVRSPLAHARITRHDPAPAMAAPGAVAVVTGDDVADVPAIPMRLKLTADPVDHALQPVLARGRVRYVGEPVAAVVAEDPYGCADMAELVAVDYEPLPVVLDATAALEAGAPALWDGHGNKVTTLVGAYGDVEAAFSAAAWY